MYAQIANADSATYPITLQLYANTILTGAPLESCKHSTIVHEFLQKDSVWAALHTKGDRQFASFEKTKKFITRGIDHWHNIKKSEENRQRDERKMRRIKRNVNALVFIAVCLFAGHTYLEVVKGRLIKQLDCLYDDYFRLVGEIHFKYVKNLEGGASRDSLVNAWVNTLLTDTWRVDSTMDALHTTSALRFALHYADWKATLDTLLDDTTRKGILQSALDKKLLTPKSNTILTIEGYKLFDNSDFPKAEDTVYIIDCSQCEFVRVTIDF